MREMRDALESALQEEASKHRPWLGSERDGKRPESADWLLQGQLPAGNTSRDKF